MVIHATGAACRADLPEEGSDKPKAVIRPYTPVDGGKGYLDLIVKVGHKPFCSILGLYPCECMRSIQASAFPCI